MLGVQAAYYLVVAGLLLTVEAFLAATGGLEVFDRQPALTAAAVAEQLPAYTPAARAVYWRFTLIDTLYPVLFAVGNAVLAAYFLRLGLPALYLWAARTRALLALLLPLPLDLAQNAAAVLVIAQYPPLSPALAEALVALNILKFWAMDLTSLVVAALIVLGLGAALWRKFVER